MDYSFTIKQIAEQIHGTVIGDASRIITKPSSLEEGSNDTIAFADNARSLQKAQDADLGALIIPEKMSMNINETTVIKVAVPRLAFIRVLNMFKQPHTVYEGIHPTAVISKTAQIGKNPHIGAYTVIEDDVVLGDNTVIYPHVYIGKSVHIGNNGELHHSVSIYPYCTIGDRVIIKAHSVIGGEGFGYFQDSGKHYKVPQIGTVMIKDDVHIGSGTCIDRATTGTTIIGNDVKIDNLVQIAHNCSIGDHTIIVSQVGIAGSAKIGKHCMIGGQVGIADHAELDDEVILLARSGVSKVRVKKGRYFGAPHKPAIKAARIEAVFGKLPQMAQDIQDIKKQLNKNNQ